MDRELISIICISKNLGEQGSGNRPRFVHTSDLSQTHGPGTGPMKQLQMYASLEGDPQLAYKWDSVGSYLEQFDRAASG